MDADVTSRTRFDSIMRCSAWAYIVAYPVAGLVGLLIGFPIPIAGYMSGLEAVVPSIIAVVLFSLFGLFPALLFCGAVVGFFIPLENVGRKIWPSRFELIWSSVAALIPLVLLSITDRLFGPW